MEDRWLYAWGLASVGFGGASLIVPLYVVALGGSGAVVGVLFATGSFVGVPAALGAGLLADRTGKRRAFVLAAVATTAAMLVAIPAVETIPLVIAANAVLWFAFAGSLPVLSLLAVVGAPEAEWSDRIARLNEVQGIGWAAGLALGFVVVTGGSRRVDVLTAQRAYFLVCSACTAVGLVVALRTLPPDPRPGATPSPRKLRRRLREARRFSVRSASFPFTPARVDVRQLHPRTFYRRFTPTLALYFLAVVLFFGGFGVFFAPLPVYLTALGYGSSEIFGLYLVSNVGAAAFFGGAARLAGKYEVTLVHAGGLLVRGAALPVVVLVGTLLGGTLVGLGAAAVVFVVLGLCWAVIAVTAGTLVTRLAPATVRGEAFGLYSALSALAGGVGGLLGGWLGDVSYGLAFGVAGGLVVLGSLVVVVLHWTASGDRASPAPGADEPASPTPGAASPPDQEGQGPER